MKRSLLFLSIVSLLILSACSGDEPEPKNAKRYGGEVSYTAFGSTTTLSVNSIYVVSGTLELKSFLGDSKESPTALGITISTGIAETSYDVRNGVASVYYSMYDGNGNFYYTGSTPVGNVVITEIDEESQTMSGTFTATLQRKTGQLEITDGTFTDVPYVVQQEAKGTSTIAKLDGVDFKGELTSYGIGSTVGFMYTDKYRVMHFELPHDIEPGVYDVADLNELEYVGVYYIDGLYSYQAVSGTITITEHTEEVNIKGTFELEVESIPLDGTSKSFTEGAFDVAFEF